MQVNNRLASLKVKAMLIRGRKLSNLLGKTTGGKNSARILAIQRAAKAWLSEFSDLINDESLTVPGKPQGIKGVPATESQALWNMEEELSRAIASSREQIREKQPV